MWGFLGEFKFLFLNSSTQARAFWKEVVWGLQDGFFLSLEDLLSFAKFEIREFKN